MTDPKIIVALDYAHEKQALELVDRLDNKLCRLKVGKEMFTHLGPGFIEKLHKREFQVFLDLKYHDIPNTVARACSAAADLGIWMLNVHAFGGRQMMEASVEAIANREHKPHLIAVTVLTSMSDADLQEMGIQYTASEMALKLASMARECGLDGVVCSAQEASAMRQSLGSDFLLVTPGIRPTGASSDDQHRIMTPADAIHAGSSYLVIGRPITQAEDPVGILRTINSDIC
ncbi:MAG: orotidine-5'-phosphate decarboxylase [Gammaproteobacteria bacterium]